MLKELREKQARIATQMREMLEAAEKEDRNFTADEQEKWASMEQDFDALEERIKRAQAVEGIDDQLKQTIDDYNLRHNPQWQKPADDKPELREDVREFYDARRFRSLPGNRIVSAPTETDDEYVVAFRDYLRHGLNGMSRRNAEIFEARAQSTGTDSAGGFTVPTGFRADIEVAMQAFSGIRRGVTIWTTPSGNAIEWPTVNDTGNSGRLLGENAAETPTDVTFGQVVFDAYKYSSDTVLVPVELAQDTGINLEQTIARLLGERLGRITATHYATGTGSGQPNGLFTAATSGVTAASNSAITYDEILDLIHSVDPAYRLGPNVGFVFNDSTLKELKQLKDETNSNRPLWAPNIAEEVPATIDGFSYIVDQAAPSIGSSTTPVAFGDLSKYVIRDVMSMSLSVLRELYAANHQVGYVAILRTDADLLDAGTNPIKTLTMAV